MTVQVIAASGDQLVLSFVYDPTGLVWVQCSDHRVAGWLGDDGAGPGRITPATPILTDGLPPQPPNTGAILSPRWAQIFEAGQGVIAPDQFRGQIQDFLTWLVTNNGANRKIGADFLHPELQQIWRTWLAGNEAFAL